MTYHKTPHCEHCKQPCPQPFKTLQNHKAMYLSERQATYLHEACWLAMVKFTEDCRRESLAAAGFTLEQIEASLQAEANRIAKADADKAARIARGRRR